jgi:hypothetical protein
MFEKEESLFAFCTESSFSPEPSRRAKESD